MSEETKTAEAQAAPAGEAPQTGAPTAPVELTVQDLGVLRSIIDVASQRGAFKANEMEAVGKTFNKLDAFLQTVQKAEEEAKAKTEGTAPAEAPKGDA
jgi:hypothetical protein